MRVPALPDHPARRLRAHASCAGVAGVPARRAVAAAVRRRNRLNYTDRLVGTNLLAILSRKNAGIPLFVVSGSSLKIAACALL